MVRSGVRGLLRKCSRAGDYGVGDVGVKGSDINRYRDGVESEGHGQRQHDLKEMVGIFVI